MNKKEASEFINKCERERLRILGIDRYDLVEGRKVFDELNIADFSNSDIFDSLFHSRKFLELSPDGYFEIITE